MSHRAFGGGSDDDDAADGDADVDDVYVPPDPICLVECQPLSTCDVGTSSYAWINPCYQQNCDA